MKIALSGKAGAGKGLVASIMKEELEARTGVSHTIGSFAYPIKRFLQLLLDLDDAHLYGHLKEVPQTFFVTPDTLNTAAKYYRIHLDKLAGWDKFWGKFTKVFEKNIDCTGTVYTLHSISPRELFQKTGTEVGRSLNPNLWIKALLYSPDTIDIVDDLRFKSEQEALSKSHYVIVHIEAIQGVDMQKQHQSESEFNSLDVDFVLDNRFEVHNEKTMGVLRDRVVSLLKAIEYHNLYKHTL